MLFSFRTAFNEKRLLLHPRRNPPRLRSRRIVLASPHLLPAAQQPEFITRYRPKLSHDHDSETGAGGKGSVAVNLKHGSLWRPQPSCGTAHLNPVACGATLAVPGQVLDSMEEGWSMVSGRLIQLPSGPASLAPKEPEALAAPVIGFPKMGNLHARHSVLKHPEYREACAWRAHSAASHLHTRLVEAARFGEDGRAGIAEVGHIARPIHVDACQRRVAAKSYYHQRRSPSCRELLGAGDGYSLG